jgi:hypothetical protein
VHATAVAHLVMILLSTHTITLIRQVSMLQNLLIPYTDPLVLSVCRYKSKMKQIQVRTPWLETGSGKDGVGERRGVE